MPNLGAEVTLLDASGLLLILIIFHYKSMVSTLYNHCHFHQLSSIQGVFGNVPNLGAEVTLFEASGLLVIFY